MQFPENDVTKLPLAGGTMTGAIKAADGAAATPSVYWGTNSGFWNDIADSGIGISLAGTAIGFFSAVGLNFSIPGGGNSALNITGEGISQSLVRRFSNDVNAPLGGFVKGRGTIASPVTPNVNDFLGQITFSGLNTTGSTGNTIGAMIRAKLTEPGSVSSTAMGSRLEIRVAPNGSGTLADVAYFNNEAGLSMFGANTVIDANRVFRRRVFTVGTLPTGVSGMATFVSDALGPTFGAAVVGGGAVPIPVYHDGTSWKVG